jgi:hypothetical protein
VTAPEIWNRHLKGQFEDLKGRTKESTRIITRQESLAAEAIGAAAAGEAGEKLAQECLRK